MDSYVVRIYRRAGRKSPILIGPSRRRGQEENGFLQHRGVVGNPQVPAGPGSLPTPPPERRLRKEVISATAASDLKESAEGVRQTKPTLGH